MEVQILAAAFADETEKIATSRGKRYAATFQALKRALSEQGNEVGTLASAEKGPAKVSDELYRKAMVFLKLRSPGHASLPRGP